MMPFLYAFLKKSDQFNVAVEKEIVQKSIYKEKEKY